MGSTFLRERIFRLSAVCVHVFIGFFSIVLVMCDSKKYIPPFVFNVLYCFSLV